MNHTGMLPCLPKVIGVLQPKPMRRVRLTEGHFNPQCHFRRNRSTPIQQLRQRLAAHTKMVGGVGDGQAQRGQAPAPSEFLPDGRGYAYPWSHLLNGNQESRRRKDGEEEGKGQGGKRFPRGEASE
jgi:hypothetical protein